MEFNIDLALGSVRGDLPPAIHQNQSSEWVPVTPSPVVVDIKNRFWKALQAAENVYNYGAPPFLKTNIDEEAMEVEREVIMSQFKTREDSCLKETLVTEKTLLLNNLQPKNYGTFN